MQERVHLHFLLADEFLTVVLLLQREAPKNPVRHRKSQSLQHQRRTTRDSETFLGPGLKV